MRILSFAASSSLKSINKALVRHAGERLRGEYLPAAQVELVDLNDFEMPIFSVDRERDSGVPSEAQQFFDKIGAADALLVSYAEHNGSYSAAFKNLFDWSSRISMKVFQGRPMVALSTSPGGRGGATVLQSALSSAPRFGTEVVASLSVPAFHDNFDADQGVLSNAELSADLGRALEALAQRLNTPA